MINIAHDIDWSESPESANYEDLERRFLMIQLEPFDDSVPETIPNPSITMDNLDPFRLTTSYFPAVSRRVGEYRPSGDCRDK